MSMCVYINDYITYLPYKLIIPITIVIIKLSLLVNNGVFCFTLRKQNKENRSENYIRLGTKLLYPSL